MDYALITFASATAANHVKTVLLRQFNIHSEVIQTPAAIGLKSCCFSLKIRRNVLEKTWSIIAESGLSSKGAYDAETFLKLK